MKQYKNYFVILLIYYSTIAFAQERTDYIGTWDRTSNTVLGIKSDFPAKLSIYDNGTYKEVRQDIQGKESIYNGTWDLSESGDINLFTEDEFEKTYTKYVCYGISENRKKIYYRFFEDTENKIWTAKDTQQITVYTKAGE